MRSDLAVRLVCRPMDLELGPEDALRLLRSDAHPVALLGAVVEDDLCGHATLAAAHALREDGRLAGGVRFMTRSGVLRADAGPHGAITLDFPRQRSR